MLTDDEVKIDLGAIGIRNAFATFTTVNGKAKLLSCHVAGLGNIATQLLDHKKQQLEKQMTQKLIQQRGAI